MNGFPSFQQCFWGVAVGPDAAIVHRNVMRRRCPENLPEGWSGKAFPCDGLGDGTADHDGVSVPSVKGRDSGWAVLGSQCRDRRGVHQWMINREED